MGCEAGRWMELAQDRVQWLAVVLAVLNLRFLLPQCYIATIQMTSNCRITASVRPQPTLTRQSCDYQRVFNENPTNCRSELRYVSPRSLIKHTMEHRREGLVSQASTKFLSDSKTFIHEPIQTAPRS
jgi:hypothetical protein